MIDKLIVDDARITLTDADKLPYTYVFSTAKTHTVRYALSETNEIAASAFANCSNMVSVKFPPEIEMIKRRAFENCSRLNNVVIPETVKYIGANCWDGCSSLTEMRFEADTPPTNYAEIPGNCKVYIPDDSKYANAGAYDGLTPNTTNYYKKEWYNAYTYVPARNMNNATQYYYDRWTSIAPNDQTIEEKNRIIIDKIVFETNTLNVTAGTNTTLSFRIDPVDATNTKLYLDEADKDYNPNVAEVKDIASDNIYIAAKAQGKCVVKIYSESGVYDYVTINVSRATTTQPSTPSTPTEPEEKEEPETPEIPETPETPEVNEGEENSENNNETPETGDENSESNEAENNTED